MVKTATVEGMTDATNSVSIIPADLVVAIDHVGIAVPDFDAAVSWWADNMGMENTHEEINEEQGVREAMLAPRNAPAGGAMIQLLAPLNENSTIAKFIDRNGPGLQQMAVRVSNIDQVMEHLRANNVRVLYPEPKRGTANSRINFVHPKDAGGVLLELVEPAASH